MNDLICLADFERGIEPDSPKWGAFVKVVALIDVWG
jgi:hypothetical protein